MKIFNLHILTDRALKQKIADAVSAERQLSTAEIKELISTPLKHKGVQELMAKSRLLVEKFSGLKNYVADLERR